MLNHIVIMGRLTRDPELRRTGSGIAVANFTVAVDSDFKPKNGEKKTNFFDCTAWRQAAEFVSKYFAKGRMIVVSGSLDSEDWTDDNGNKRRKTFIVADNCYFGDSKRDSEGGAPSSYGGNSYGNSGGYGGNAYPEAAAAADRYMSQGSYVHQGGYPAPQYPQQDFAELTDDDAQLPF